MYEAPVFEPDVEASELPRRTVGVLVMVKCSGDFALVIQLRKGVCVLVLDEVVEKVAGLFGVGWASVAGCDCWCRQVVHSEGYFQVASSLSSARPERLDAVSDVVEAVIGSGGEIVGNQGWRRKALCCWTVWRSSARAMAAMVGSVEERILMAWTMVWTSHSRRGS